MDERVFPDSMPVIALRGLAVYPDQTVHFDVGRIKSVFALEEAMKRDQYVFLVPQNDIVVEDPEKKDLCSIGTIATVKQILKPQGEVLRILVNGISRAYLQDLTRTEPYLYGTVKPIRSVRCVNTPDCQALCREAVRLFGEYLNMSDRAMQSVHLKMMASEDPGFLADSIGQHTSIPVDEKILLLRETHPIKRLEKALKMLNMELEIMNVEAEIQDKTQANMNQNQRDYFLREQMKVIREELGEGDDEAEFTAYEHKIRQLQLEETYEKKLLKDLDRLKKQQFGSAEAAVLRSYLDAVLELPWHTGTKERINVSAASKILENDHFGLEKVKERILQTIAVRQMSPDMPPQILCLVGPPGVGKTSIAYSIARALNRKLARIALGGVHDEAEIRGHRKTYVGAMPGRIMYAVNQAGSNNPILLLDEIDKMGSDYRGDPSAALLEVLDAEQNKTYRDHYLEIPFDLSNVMFITTANTLDTVPRPLLDRMEIIEIGSYTDEEKLMIAKKHLLSKQMKKHGLKRNQLRLSDDTIREIIYCYTRESGVRQLERCIAELCRKADMALVSDETVKRVSVNASNVSDYLGVHKFLPDRRPAEDQIGLVTGLAWTAVGGETLEVEVNVMDGTGKLELTGNLGDVMKESAHAALSYIRANASKLGVSPDFYKTKDIHVHFPAGAVPKDGPSAGVTVCTAMVSALTDTPVRRDVAMTGEISLRGRVLPIGGLKEKTMAALRHGVSTVIIPADNLRDLEEIDQTVRRSLNFVTARSVDTVLETALRRECKVSAAVIGDIPVEIVNRNRTNSIRQ